LRAENNSREGYRVTVISEEGEALYDTYAARNKGLTIGNQNNEPEVFAAIVNDDRGYAGRIDSLTKKLTHFIAKVFFLSSDPTEFFVIRVGKEVELPKN